MGYYTRVLTTMKDCVAISVLASALKKERCRAVIQTEDDPGDWNQAILTHPGIGGCISPQLAICSNYCHLLYQCDGVLDCAGKQLGSNSLPEQNNTARSITLSSCRMLPGQS